MSFFALFLIEAAVIGSLFWLFFGLYREYRVDKLRHRLFKIRDELFDHAHAGEIEFEHSAYGITRTTFNGLIRFAHDLSFYRVLSLYLISKLTHHAPDSGYGDAFTRALDRLNKPQREMITQLHLRAFGVVLIHMVHVSVIFGPFMLLLKIVREVLRPFLTLLRLFGWVANTLGKGAEGIVLWVVDHAAEMRIDLEAKAYEIGKETATVA